MTRRSIVPVQQRMLRLARYLYDGGILTSAWIRYDMGVDLATAKRDMRIIECYLPIEHFERRGDTKKMLRISRK